MSQETLGYVKLEWTCPKCGTRNPGPEKTCVSCGAPQPDNVQFEAAQGQQLSQDESLKKIAEAGPDIHCPFCGTRNPATAAVCSQCGGELKEGARREAGKVIGAYAAKPVQQIACPNCGTMNPETALKCSSCGAALGRRPVVAPAAATKSAALPSWVWIAVVVLAGICLLGGGGLMISRSMSREDLTGQVADVQWQTVVDVQALGPVSYQDWQDGIPADANVGACDERVRSVEINPPASGNYNKVCGTPYTIDTGSGVGRVVQDCQYEVMEPYCEYTVQEWQTVQQVTEQGSNLSPFWPQPQLVRGQRLGEKSDSYVVVFETNDGEYEYTVGSLEEFQRYAVGSDWILTLNGFNQIVGLEPAQ